MEKTRNRPAPAGRKIFNGLPRHAQKGPGGRTGCPTAGRKANVCLLSGCLGTTQAIVCLSSDTPSRRGNHAAVSVRRRLIAKTVEAKRRSTLGRQRRSALKERSIDPRQSTLLVTAIPRRERTQPSSIDDTLEGKIKGYLDGLATSSVGDADRLPSPRGLANSATFDRADEQEWIPWNGRDAAARRLTRVCTTTLTAVGRGSLATRCCNAEKLILDG